MLQKEREAEGDEFAEKEKFVTGAYKQQQEEVQKEAAAEELRRKEEERRRGTGQGLQAFRMKMLDIEDKKHQDAVTAVEEAAKAGVKGNAPLVAQEEVITDAELARRINAQGGHVILNDDGQVADKRQLLRAGLNVVPKSKHDMQSAAENKSRAPQQHSYQGRNVNQKSMRERQSRMLEQQLEQATKRAAEDEAEERKKLEQASKSRKTGDEISSARERYLQRKREAAAGKGGG
jgi:hypothetical protein